MPDFDKRVGLEHGDQFLAYGQVKGRIPEHFSDVDGEVHQQRFQVRTVVKNLVLQFGNALKSAQSQPMLDTPF